MTSDLDPHNDATLLRDLLLNRYRVEGMLGEGGLGRVVKAYDTRLKRTVAIKTLKRSLAATDPGHYRAAEDRFTREAEAGSRVGDHPNLVTVYDLVADAEGTQYLICQYVPGGTLADRIAHGPLPLADALRLTADAARGLQAAHDAGIVHRDIKPSNIFLAADGHAQVGDFGIAQMDHLSNRTHALTSHPGTPLYMSPEQAQTTGYVRPDTDQYSLGLVLFEMLTGTAYKRLRERETTALLAAQPTDVAALIRQMTAQHPDDRHDSLDDVIAVISDIGRQIPTIATPPQDSAPAPAPLEKRHDTPHLADVTVRAPMLQQATPYIPESPVSTLATPRLDMPTIPDQITERQRPRAVLPAHAKMSLPVPSQPTSPRHTRRAVVIGIGGLVAVATGSAGYAYLNLRSDTLLGTLTGHTDRVFSVVFSPDGQTLATASGDSTARLWHASNGTLLHTLSGHTSSVKSVAFSPSGDILVTGSDDKTARLWSVSNGTHLRTLTGHMNSVQSLAFGSGSQMLATGSADDTARLWTIPDGTPLRILTGHTNSVQSVAFSPDGQVLATGSHDETARLWRITDGTPLRTLIGHTKFVTGVAFSPDGQTLATGSDDETVRLWRVADGGLLHNVTYQTSAIFSVAFSPDVQMFATGSLDKTARLWRVADGILLHSFTGHTDWIQGVAFSPNGKMLATASDDRTVRLWRLG